MMHGHEKSDSVIVAVKPANKAVHPAAEQSAAEAFAAEPGEPRAETKGNADQQTMPWAQANHARWTAYGKSQGKGRRRSLFRSSTTSASISSRRRSTNSRWTRHREWT